MKLDFDQNLTDFTGKPITFEDGGPVITLRHATFLAMKSAIPSDQTDSISARLALGIIAEKIAKGEELDIPQVAKLKERLQSYFVAPVMVLAIERAIEDPHA